MKIVKIGTWKKYQSNIGFQILFWTALFLLIEARNYGEYEDANIQLIFYYDLCHWIFQIISANFIYYVLIKYFFDRKKYVLFSVLLLVSLYVFSAVNRFFIVYIAEPFFCNFPQDSIYSIFTDIRYLLISYTFSIITGAFAFVSVMFMLRYKSEKQNTTKLLKEKAELELKVLKSQLNPHFLFNTLNNIYSLSIINSGKTSESISRLSDILDYVLYKGQNKTVNVSDEISIIDDYIELEKLRYDERLKIFKTQKLNSENKIPPLLYLSLVENSFKHGAGKSVGDIEINIEIETNENQSVFRIKNTYSEILKSERESLGLNNIEEQLKIFYNNQFEFNILQSENWFSVEIITPATE